MSDPNLTRRRGLRSVGIRTGDVKASVRVGGVCLGDPWGRRRTGEPGHTWVGAVVALALRGEPEHMGESERAGEDVRAALSESALLLPAQSVL